MKKISKRITVAAGVIPVRVTENGYEFLMLRTNNFWEFPKGKQEDGEDLLDTALRETSEETNLTPNDLNFKWGKISRQSEKYKKGSKYVVYFIAETTVKDIKIPVNPQLGRPEHDEWRWLNYEEARKISNDRIKAMLDWANGIING